MTDKEVTFIVKIVNPPAWLSASWLQSFLARNAASSRKITVTKEN